MLREKTTKMAAINGKRQAVVCCCQADDADDDADADAAAAVVEGCLQ